MIQLRSASILRRSASICVAAYNAILLPAQTTNPSASAVPGIVPNGDFENVTTQENIWDGVDSSGKLRVLTYANVITEEGGNPASVNFPCSPQFVDMDGDGLNDLVVGDPSGFIWVFKNRGEKGTPRFTTGEFIPSYYGGAVKIWAGDFSGNGRADLIVGTAYGHVLYVPNLGTPQKWKFTRDMGKPRYCWPGYPHPGFELPYLKLGKEEMLFGTYMAPTVYDWDGDGKRDLILGDGTYSANSVWLLRNVGSNQNPRFEPDEKFYLAYGRGREQLAPTVCDINGDGLPDLICGDRQGFVNLFLNAPNLPREDPKLPPGTLPSVKKEQAPPRLPFRGCLKLGDLEKFPVPLAVAACDWNEDGLIDLLLGFPDGTMAVALNEGTRTEPSFGAPQPIRGTDTELDFPTPAGWSYSYTGNPNSCFTVRALVEDKLPGGEVIKPKSGERMCKFSYEHEYPGWTLRDQWIVGGRAISIGTGPMTIGHKYEVSIWARGARVNPIWRIDAQAAVRANRRNRAEYATYSVESPFAVAEGDWRRFAKTFICPGPEKSQRIKPEDDQLSFSLSISFPWTGYCYIDDVKITEIKQPGIP